MDVDSIFTAEKAVRCPHFKKCLARELLRYLVSAIIAIVAAYTTACAVKMRGPGFDIDVRPANNWVPSDAHQPTTRE